MIAMSLASTTLPESAAQLPLLLWLLVGVVGFIVGAVCVFISVNGIRAASLAAARLAKQPERNTESISLVVG